MTNWRKGSGTAYQAYHKTRGRRDETPGRADKGLEGRSRVHSLSTPLIRTRQEKEDQSRNTRKMKLSCLPAAVLFLCLLEVLTRAAPPNSDTRQHFVQYSNCYAPSATATYTITSFCPNISQQTFVPPPQPGCCIKSSRQQL